jgi:alkanesulfonate monooxygenase SsuD/methylene tetrahydromethanopterin reductase-like flavin-dependent oxidoreductase (luciferase family)
MVRYGLVIPNWEAGSDVGRLVEVAIAAEEGGWDGVFLADHLIFPPPSEIGALSVPETFLPMPDPWISLAGIATATKRVALGTWITPVPRRQPWQLARDLATLDRLSNGRVILGVGLGRRPDYELFGEPWDLSRIGGRADEALALIDRFWSGEPVTYHGDHFQVDGVALLPTPVQRPRIPIVVGGIWPRRSSVRRGARWDGIMTHFPGDGVLPPDGTPPEVHAEALVAYYRSITDRPGEVFLPSSPVGVRDDWADFAMSSLGATWLYTAKIDGRWTLDLDRVSEGPQRT